MFTLPNTFANIHILYIMSKKTGNIFYFFKVRRLKKGVRSCRIDIFYFFLPKYLSIPNKMRNFAAALRKHRSATLLQS